jgi:hypothetical protein
MEYSIRREQYAADLRRRSARYRRLAAFYAGDVAATILAEAVDLESVADAVEERNASPDPLRPHSDAQASAS